MTARGKHKRTWWQWFVKNARNAAASTIIATAISTLLTLSATALFEWNKENNRERADAIKQSEQRFSASHNTVIAKVGLYTNRVYEVGTADRTEVLAAIIETQSQLLTLRSRLTSDDYAAIAAYAAELNKLQRSLNAVSKPTDLGPVYQSVQRLLAYHDDIDARVQERADVPFL